MLESGVSELLQSFWVFMKQLTLTGSELLTRMQSQFGGKRNYAKVMMHLIDRPKTT